MIAGALGAILLVGTFANIVRTLILPRGTGSRLATSLLRVWRGLLRTSVRWSDRYETRDRTLAWLAPLTLLSQLALWLATLLVGYGLLLKATSGLGWRAAVREAGSSLFTLGYASTARLHLSLIDFVAAASGPIVIALQIAYLPTLYAAYNRRETEVTLLGTRAGEPSWGPELLARQGLVDTVGQLPHLYQSWERLSADVGESHANYPVLLAFRSPRPYQHWLIAMLAVMDGAALHLSLAPKTAPPEARLAVRAGFSALRDIADVVGIPYDPDPRPDAPITLRYEQFLEGVKWAENAGFQAEVTPEEAWPHFRGWRVNYEQIAYALARRVDAVPARWSGPRDWTTDELPPNRPPHRHPDRP
ncbi:hypothetical protein [Planosporangium thailandense]|uniref:hypothetical protein n=1 Tax=Planosporangium thailandense TaxID=765197 RepID=UPI00197C328A|nr:hypothetical protein [Planosporangium thailandense]